MQSDESEKWVKEINRGGLITIDDTMYQLLVSMELELRKYFSSDNVGTETSLKDVAFEKIHENEDVLFYWAIISVNWDAGEATELLRLITEHYITIRGFSFTSAFMERYKQTKKKTTQKSKGLRKTLPTTQICHKDT